MRIGRHFSRAWGDTVPLVWPDMNTTQVNEGAHGLMDGLTHAFAPVHRAYFRYVASPESEVAFDTNKTYQIMCNLYSAGAIDVLLNPVSFNSKTMLLRHYPACRVRLVVYGFGKTDDPYVSPEEREKPVHERIATDTAGRTNSLSTACLGFHGRMLAFSIPVGRVGGYGTFMGPSDLPCGKDRTAREESCTLRAAAVARARELLRLPDHGEFVRQTRDVFHDLVTVQSVHASDVVAVGAAAHRWFTPGTEQASPWTAPLAPAARHCIPPDRLPVKPRDDELWPPTVFEPFAEWLESPSTSRSGRKRQPQPLTGAKLREAPPDVHWPKVARTPDEQLRRERWWKELSHVPKGLWVGFQKRARAM